MIFINYRFDNLPFKLGIDVDGNYGYYKAGADTVTPFKSFKILETRLYVANNSKSATYVYTIPEDYNKILIIVSSACSNDSGGGTDKASSSLSFSYSNPDATIEILYNAGGGAWGSMIMRVYEIQNVKKNDVITNRVYISYTRSYLCISFTVLKL